ncbi:MAG: TIGR03752 family integrating conjugative element protein [Legionellales bacterium]|nr:TIGR03752 family integrating conjugative element protein [Legionellales bacterium]
MFKNLSKTTQLFGGLIAAVFVILVIVISIVGNETPKEQPAHYVNDNASADNKVEALKTMTADLLNVENKNKQLEQTVQHLQAQNKNAISDLKKSLSDQVQTALEKIQNQNEEKQQAFEESLKQKIKTNAEDYPINGTSDSGSFIWISDLSKTAQKKTSAITKTGNGLFDLNDNTESLLHDNNAESRNAQKKNPAKPIYTIPMNATLTGATLMTPLVGRVPIDGKLPSPYHFKLVLSANNLTANGYPLSGVKGAVMSGIASGDMLGHCARGDIHSITFIFNDGTISTTKAKGNDNSLGYISSQTGNPCIAGSFHSDAGLFLGAQMGLSAAEGYANALSSAQYRNSTTAEGATFSTLIGSANKAALGQGASAASQAAQTWWNRRVQNSFDYVYVPNIDHQTGKPTKVVVNITQQIPINYDVSARKVSYEDALQTDHRELD